MKGLLALKKGTQSSRTSKTIPDKTINNTGVGMSQLDIDLETT